MLLIFVSSTIGGHPALFLPARAGNTIGPQVDASSHLHATWHLTTNFAANGAPTVFVCTGRQVGAIHAGTSVRGTNVD